MQTVWRGWAVLVGLVAAAACQPRQQTEQPTRQEGPSASAQQTMGANVISKPTTAEEKIGNAMAAAPRAIATGAAVVDWPATSGATPTVLRQGSNGWTCFPDWPVSPDVDPSCYDRMGMKFMEGYLSGTTPRLQTAGIAYMLAGGSEASNTDPFATQPAPGQSWMRTPPHIMLFPSGPLDTIAYPRDPGRGGPWIMFPGTAYEHLMIPIR